MNPQKQANKRARAGAAFLDIELPGWRDDITRPIVMQNPGDCVLTQACKHDNFTECIENILMISFEKAENLGFDIAENDDNDLVEYHHLDKAWNKVLSEPPIEGEPESTIPPIPQLFSLTIDGEFLGLFTPGFTIGVLLQNPEAVVTLKEVEVQ